MIEDRWEDLCAANQNKYEPYKELGKTDMLCIVAEQIVNELEEQLVIDLAKIEDGGVLLKRLRTIVTDSVRGQFRKHWDYFEQDLDLREIGDYIDIILEIIIRSFRQHAVCGPDEVEWCELTPYVSQVHLVIFSIIEERSEGERKDALESECQKYLDRRLESAHPDESSAAVAPAQKARLLRRAINHLNKIGIRCVHDFDGAKFAAAERNYLNMSTSDFKYAEKFFSVNRGVTVEEVVRIAELCAQKALLGDVVEDGEFDPIWYERRAQSVGFLLRNWARINEQLYG